MSVVENLAHRISSSNELDIIYYTVSMLQPKCNETQLTSYTKKVGLHIV